MDDNVIGECQQHSTKIKNCLGASALAALAHKPVIHSAVSLGTGSFAVDYARQMSNGLSSQEFQECETVGVDTGLLDHLLYSGGVLGVLRFDQASGPMTDVQVCVCLSLSMYVCVLCKCVHAAAVPHVALHFHHAGSGWGCTAVVNAGIYEYSKRKWSDRDKISIHNFSGHA